MAHANIEECGVLMASQWCLLIGYGMTSGEMGVEICSYEEGIMDRALHQKKTSKVIQTSPKVFYKGLVNLEH